MPSIPFARGILLKITYCSHSHGTAHNVGKLGHHGITPKTVSVGASGS